MTLQNEPLSALTHLVGAVLAVVGLVLLVVTASLHGSATAVVSFSIFGVMMIILYTMSTIFHFICSTKQRLKRIFQIFDHCSIYLLIAGTYTPVALIALPPAWGWSIFGSIWGLALLGIVLKATPIKFPAYLSLLLYLVMGWLIVLCLDTLFSMLTPDGIFWLVTGGVSYSIGAIFFALDTITPRTRWFGTHEIFHLFVMFGSFSHFWLLYRHLL